MHVDWVKERSRNGGADEVPLPPGATSGRLWLCGKHFIGADVELALQKTGATTVVCLNQEHEIGERYPEYIAWLRAHAGERALWFPVPDLHAPDLDRAREILGVLRERLERGATLLVHCGAGIGRAGTIAAALLVTMGVELHDAIGTVARARPMAGPEAGAQLDLLTALADVNPTTAPTTTPPTTASRDRSGGPGHRSGPEKRSEASTEG